MKETIIFAAGIAFCWVLNYFFRKPTTTNLYKGNVKNKVKGEGNTQTNDNRAEINGGMSRREVVKLLKSLKN